MHDFKILQKADVSVPELAWLLNQSRSTVYKWVYGKSAPSSANGALLRSMLDHIEYAVERSVLPLPVGTPRAERKQKLQDALAPL